MAGPLYLMWFDDNPKIPVGKKVEQAIAAYVQRFHAAPNVVLVNEGENDLLQKGRAQVGQEHVLVRSASYVRRNNYWVGQEHEEQSPAPA